VLTDGSALDNLRGHHSTARLTGNLSHDL
jgi:hypothetical protein